jgi:trigger factor
MEDAAFTPSAYQLPAVEVPCLDDLRVQVEAPPSPTAEELIERLHSRLREWTRRRERRAGEPIEVGDEVECDLVTLVEQRVVPGGVMAAARLEVREFLHLPGMLEQLLALSPGATTTFQLTLPANYPVASLAQRQATVFLRVRRVFQLDSVSLDDLSALRAAGLGESLDEALETVAAEIDAEQANQLMVSATQTVLNSLADRLTVELPPQAIDQELRLSWQRDQQALLGDSPFAGDLARRAEADFLSDPRHRSEAERRIKVGMALGALIEQQGLAPDAEIMTMLLESAAEQSQSTLDEVKAVLRAEPARAFEAGTRALHLKAIEYVMSRAHIEVLDPP